MMTNGCKFVPKVLFEPIFMEHSLKHRHGQFTLKTVSNTYYITFALVLPFSYRNITKKMHTFKRKIIYVESRMRVLCRARGNCSQNKRFILFTYLKENNLLDQWYFHYQWEPLVQKPGPNRTEPAWVCRGTAA